MSSIIDRALCDVEVGWATLFACIDRCFSAQHERDGWNTHNKTIMTRETHKAIVGNITDVHKRHIPFHTNSSCSSLHALLHNNKHAFLRLRQHDLIGAQALLAQWHVVEINRHPNTALGAHLSCRARNARSSHVLHTHNNTGIDQLK